MFCAVLKGNSYSVWRSLHFLWVERGSHVVLEVTLCFVVLKGNSERTHTIVRV